MFALLSTLTGMASGLVPTLVKMANAHTEHKREMETMRFQGALQKELGTMRLEETKVQTDSDDKKAAYKHDIAIGEGASQWVINIRTLQRPFIGLLVLLLFAFITVWVLTTQPAAIPLVLIIEFAFAITGNVIGFYFTDRSMNKMFAPGN